MTVEVSAGYVELGGVTPDPPSLVSPH